MYRDVVRDFATRTKANLEFIRSAKRELDHPKPYTVEDPRVFETTQLINSMLGLLVFPQQHYFNSIPSTPLVELEPEGWPCIRASGDFPPVDNLNDLMRCLRNAIAHFNVEFLESGGQISGFRVWNTDPRQGHRKTWEAVLSIQDLEKITEKFLAMLLKETD